MSLQGFRILDINFDLHVREDCIYKIMASQYLVCKYFTGWHDNRWNRQNCAWGMYCKQCLSFPTAVQRFPKVGVHICKQCLLPRHPWPSTFGKWWYHEYRHYCEFFLQPSAVSIILQNMICALIGNIILWWDYKYGFIFTEFGNIDQGEADSEIRYYTIFTD